jgi:molecular chaperone GrpE (heat shock protein)
MKLLSATKTKKYKFTIDERKEPIYSIGKSKVPIGSTPEIDLFGEISQQLGQLQNIAQKEISQAKQPANITAIDSNFNLISDLVPILDSMERTLELATDFKDNELLKNWITNIAAIHRKFKGILIRQGLKEIETIGKKVDLNLHEVVEYRETNDYPDNIIIAEKQKGYLFRDKIIRDAKVIVAKQVTKS